MMSYVDEVIDLVVKKNPAEPEFHQAVKEVLESLRVVVEANEEKFRKDALLERLVENTDAYNLTPDDCYLISTASAFHDIGKVGIDESILNKPGKLTEEEFETMKEHTLIGASMLDKLEHYKDEKMIKIAYQICRWHHERYDGKGYPDGLTGEQIPIAAQVVSVADVYDALVSKRVYKDAYSHEQAMKMILNGEGGAFNPLLMEVLVEIQDKIKKEMHYEV